MTDAQANVSKGRKTESLSDIEARLLRATHELAGTLGVDPRQALRALASVVQRRAEFERLKGAAKPASLR